MKTIDLKEYGKPHPADDRIRFYLTAEQGKDAAERSGLKEALLAGKVDVVIGEAQSLGYFTSRTRDNVREAFLKGFFGPTVREVGIGLAFDRLSVNGNPLERSQWGTGVWGFLVKYMRSEERRLAKQAKAGARREGLTSWSEPGRFLIPDIGTVVRLDADWEFRMFEESRNVKFLNGIGIKGVDCWRHYHENKEMGAFKVIVRAGSELGVDRVYIRKGAGEFSSVTFNLHKGGVVVVGLKDTKAHGRFWAKLSDVNRMMVSIDMGTLSEN